MQQQAHSLYSPSRLPHLAKCPGWVSDGAPSEPAQRGTDIDAYLTAWINNNGDEIEQPPADWAEPIKNGIDTYNMLCFDYTNTEWHTQEHIEILPDVAGTADLVGINKDTSTIILVDWKTGYTDRGHAKDHLQLKAYAVGLLEKYSEQADQVAVYLVELDKARITQTRITAEDIPVIEQEIEDIIHAVKTATEWDYKPNTSCKYCARLETCSAHKSLVPVAQAEIKIDPYQWSHEELALKLPIIDELCDNLTAFVGKAKQRAFAILESGGEIKGYTIKETKGLRKWKDEGQAYGGVTAMFPDINGQAIVELKSPAQVEKALKTAGYKPKAIKEVIDPLVEVGTKRSLIREVNNGGSNPELSL